MSIIHVNQIRTHIGRVVVPLLDQPDVDRASPEMREVIGLSRGLAAYALVVRANATPQEAAAAVVDGANDNGIDAIYYDEPAKRLYLVQAKWIRSGAGEPDNGDVKKFVAGVSDLFNGKMDRFNDKVRSKEPLIRAALEDPGSRFEVIVAYTGSESLSEHSTRDLQDLATEFNDVSEVLYTTILDQSGLHRSLTSGVQGDPINLQIGVRSWGRKEAPRVAFYGQVSGDQIAAWWASARQRLFSGNLRGALGESDVNAEMRSTLERQPELFWYFNNGITLVAEAIDRSLAGGSGTDFTTFHCQNVTIVNGAQTVSTIGKAGESGVSGLEDVLVPLRMIVRDADQAFAEDVTRTNNRQNRIEGRDFVTLDPEQSRIRMELAIDGVEYQVMRTDSAARSESAFDLVEATVALSCASGTVRLPVQLKREIGRLWDDISRAPYKELFNRSVPGLHVWRVVQIQRVIDKAMDSYSRRGGSWGFSAVTTHGNRLVAALVFMALPVSELRNPDRTLEELAPQEELVRLTDHYVKSLGELLRAHYPNAIIPTLFKNLAKCEHLVREARQSTRSLGS